jgi:hypothetical protein
LRNVHVATGGVTGRMLNVAGSWVGVVQGRSEDTARALVTGLGIDRGCQSDKARRNMEAARDLENISITN